jgi:hypothetical protein
MKMSQVTSTAAASHGTLPSATKGARQSLSRMPASIALAIGLGIAATSRPSGDHSPVSMISAPTTMNAATAAGNPPVTAPMVASSARPGVVHAIEIGMRIVQLRTVATMPLAMPSTTSAEAIWETVAPTAARPWITTATELA